MADFLIEVTITHPDSTTSSVTFDITGVTNRAQAITAARTLIQSYRSKYVKGGGVELSLSAAELSRAITR